MRTRFAHRPFVLGPDKVAAAKKLVGENNVSLAVDLLEFPSEVTVAMQHIFGSTLVCVDKQSARAICEKLSLKTVTLEGDLYDPSGTLTGGSRSNGNASVLCRLSELSGLRQQLGAREQELARLGDQLESCRKQAERYQQVQSELEVKQQQLDLHQQLARSSQSGQLAGSLEKLQQQLAEQQGAADSAKAALAEVTELRDRLTSQLKDFEGNREERMAQAKAAIAAAEKQTKASAKALETAQQAEQKLSLEREETDREILAAREQLAELEQRNEQQAGVIEVKAAAELKKKEAFDAAAVALQARKEALGAYDAEAANLKGRQDEIETLKGDVALKLKQIDINTARAQKDISAAEARCAEMLRQYPWMESERQSFGCAGTEYDFKKGKPATAKETLNKKTAQLESLSKRINKKVLSMFETAEQAQPVTACQTLHPCAARRVRRRAHTHTSCGERVCEDLPPFRVCRSTRN